MVSGPCHTPPRPTVARAVGYPSLFLVLVLIQACVCSVRCHDPATTSQVSSAWCLRPFCATNVGAAWRHGPGASANLSAVWSLYPLTCANISTIWCLRPFAHIRALPHTTSTVPERSKRGWTPFDKLSGHSFGIGIVTMSDYAAG